ncbi:IclR family transcriptional regulator [Amycolatopsis sp. M39]|uniref:IclR family transcriptional regulator n=1 Tax=Amycolatopsis sp. M39 TaxID=1825094 RepID=UPI0007E07393|nr:IclR family transcriptional regulator C-terminal domain-containing protein [Amycolatopsis sp. M39]OAP24278.1 DNA-binding transcriptional activator MhpR [Amycolatopsis sp. M39]
MTDDANQDELAGPKNHRTIDRVTQILEEVVYHPGIGFAELARVLDAPKSSVHGFIRGLQAKGWLYENDRHFYLGPAIYGLTLASGHIRAGQVSQADLDALHKDTGMTVFLGVEAGDSLIYIGESGTDALTGFAARSNIRRKLISTAGGKALLAAKPDAERDAYLRGVRATDGEAISEFLGEFAEIKKTGVSRNFRHNGAQIAFASVVRNQLGETVAVAVLVGQTVDVQPRQAKVKKLLLKHVASWTQQKNTPREPEPI